jgi:hypothetical protein
MSAIEAAGFGIPTIHVDTPHVREGIGKAAVLIKPLSLQDSIAGVEMIEKDYSSYSAKARDRAEWIHSRQDQELEQFSSFIENIKRPTDKLQRQKSVIRASRANKNVW